MERKTGEIFEYNGEWYQCVEGTGCYKCCFNFNEDTCIAENPHCTCRSDRKDVVYKRLEKVGEPFYTEFYCSWVQKYKLYENNATGEYPKCHFGADYVLIEIKQDKEDMEEKKIQHYDCFFDRKPTLKEFDLDAAKAGKPVCTRDGRKARIICFDLKNEEYPIVAAIGNDSSETLLCYTINGEIVKGNYKSDKDLMMLPEKKEGWVNVYKERIYSTKEEAIEATYDGATYVDTVKISWEEQIMEANTLRWKDIEGWEA